MTCGLAVATSHHMGAPCADVVIGLLGQIPRLSWHHYIGLALSLPLPDYRSSVKYRCASRMSNKHHNDNQAVHMVRERALKDEVDNEDLMRAAVAPTKENVESSSSGKNKDLSLERLKAVGLANVTIARLRSLPDTVEKEYSAVIERAVKVFTSGDSSIEAAKTDLLQVRKECKQFIDTTIARLLEVVKDLEGCVTCGAVDAKKKEVGQLWKSVNAKGSALKVMNAKVLQFNKTITKIERGKTLAAPGETASVVVKTPPLFSVVKALFGGETGLTFGPMNSIFEAKGGVKPASLSPSEGSDPVGSVKTLAKAKKALRELAKHLRDHTSGTSPVSDFQFAKKLRKTLDKCFDPNCFTQVALQKEAAWASQVSAYEFRGHRGHVEVGFNPMCAMD